MVDSRISPTPETSAAAGVVGPGPLLPDTAGREAAPGAVLLRPATRHSREGVLDGAWWPRSRDIGAELPALVRALNESIGAVNRVGLDASAWDGLPTRLVIDGRVVHIDSFPVGDDTVLVTHGDRDYFSLLVVPPDTPPEAARAAMARSVTDNASQAGQILTDTGSAADRTRPRVGPADGPRAG